LEPVTDYDPGTGVHVFCNDLELLASGVGADIGIEVEKLAG